MQLSDGMIIVLGLFLFVAGAAVQRYALPTVHAQGVTRTIPKVWGACRGALAGSLIMEDANGTIRIIDAEDGRVLIVLMRLSALQVSVNCSRLCACRDHQRDTGGNG